MRTMMKDFIEYESKGSILSHALEHPPPMASKNRQSLGKEVAKNVFFGLTPRPATATDEPNNAIRVRRWLSNGKHKQSDYELKDVGGEDMEYSKGTWKMGNWAVEYSNLPQHLETNCKVYEEETNSKPKELHHGFDVTQSMIKELRCEVSILKTKLEKLQKRNIELELHNKRLIENFSSANAKIFNLEKHDQVALHFGTKHLEFRVMQSIIEDKFCSVCLRKVGDKEAKKPSALLPGFESRQVRSKNSMSQSFPLTLDHPVKNGGFPPPPPHPSIQHGVSNRPPPPPPPPAPHQVPYKAKTIQKPGTVVELYNSLRKGDGKQAILGPSNAASSAVNNLHNSIVDEIQNRSAHLLAIKTDVDTKGEFIGLLIEKVQSAAFEDIEDVLIFVDWLDKELSTLSDERAVLKHFNWPEKKADTLREAAFEYRDLQRLENEASSFVDDISITWEAFLKKITNLMDKLEKSIQRLTKLRDGALLSFKGCKIPTDWMLDSGMVSKIKLASVRLAKVYMKRVSMELNSVRLSEKDSMHEALVCHGVRFAYRTHQFAGGFDSETMCAFEELRKRIQVHGRNPRDLLPGALQT